MLKNFLTKEEKKTFSSKRRAKCRHEDFFTYLETEQAILDSLTRQYENSKQKNPIILEKIYKQEKYLEILNKYYYDVIVPDENFVENNDIFTKELAKEIKSYKKIQKEAKKL